MSADAVAVEPRGATWLVRLNRPRHGNALSPEMVAGLDDVLARAASSGVRAVVLRGEGRHFCTGFDLSDFERETGDSLLARFVRIELLLQRVARAPFLTVGVAQGRAIGAGADLFAACHLRLVEGDAAFAFPGARGFGLVLGTRRLAARVGSATALEWVQTADTVGADAAHEAGLVSAVLDTALAVEQAIARALQDDAAIGDALRRAVEPDAAAHDARDLELLVRSAARTGLRERIASYIERANAARQATR